MQQLVTSQKLFRESSRRLGKNTVGTYEDRAIRKDRVRKRKRDKA